MLSVYSGLYVLALLIVSEQAKVHMHYSRLSMGGCFNEWLWDLDWPNCSFKKRKDDAWALKWEPEIPELELGLDAGFPSDPDGMNIKLFPHLYKMGMDNTHLFPRDQVRVQCS